MPQTFGNSPELEVSDPQMAEMLLEEKALRILSPFVSSERTALSVAEELAMPLNSLLYQVKRLMGVGLLEISRSERRAGKALKYYRSVAQRFVVPYNLTSAINPKILLHLEHAAWEERLIDGLVRAGMDSFDAQGKPAFGLRVVLEGGRLVHKNVAGPESEYSLIAPEAPAIVDYWIGDVGLSFVEAKVLQRELCDLVARYRGRKGGGRYLLRVALAPVESES